MSLSKAARGERTPLHDDPLLIEAEAACDPFRLAPGSPSRNPAGPCASRYVYRLRPVAVRYAEAPVSLGPPRSKAGREQVERHPFRPMRRAWSASSRDVEQRCCRRGSGKSAKEWDCPQTAHRATGRLRCRLFRLPMRMGRWRWIREDFDDRVEIQINALRLIPAVVAKQDSISSDAAPRAKENGSCQERRQSERIPSEEPAKPSGSPSGAQPDCWDKQSGRSPPLRSLFRPNLPSRGCVRPANSRQGPESARPSVSERTPYQSDVPSTGRPGPQNSRKASGASRKPTIRRSRSIASCTRRTVSSIPTGSSASGEEWDVDSCALTFQEPDS